MSASVATAAVMAGVGLLGGAAVPALVRRIPEPPDDDHGDDQEPAAQQEQLSARASEPAPEQDATVPPPAAPAAPPGTAGDTKEPYAEIAATPGLAWRSAAFAAVVGAAVGLRLGWHPALLLAAYLVPVGVALSVVAVSSRMLPTWVIAPSYAVLVVLSVGAAALSGDWDDLVRAGLGWLVAGGLFFLMWVVYPAGMGYGDVRLSGLLGIALGYVGWGELLAGLFAAFLLGGLGGGLLSLLRIVDRKSYPFGPFMLLGAVVGVLVGPEVAAAYAVP